MATLKKPASWMDRPLDFDFLLDSGLLFEINRGLHLFGIALSLVTNKETGKQNLVLKDSRKEPEKMVFDQALFELGQLKLRKFMEEFGRTQDERRCKKLGWGVQHFSKPVKK